MVQKLGSRPRLLRNCILALGFLVAIAAAGPASAGTCTDTSYKQELANLLATMQTLGFTAAHQAFATRFIKQEAMKFTSADIKPEYRSCTLDDLGSASVGCMNKMLPMAADKTSEVELDGEINLDKIPKELLSTPPTRGDAFVFASGIVCFSNVRKAYTSYYD